MADTAAPNGNGAQGQDLAPAINALAQYAKDLSFENPRAPESLRSNAPQPQIDIGVEMNARSRPDGLYEVDLKLSARAMRDDGPVFVVELLYGGVFEIVGVPPTDIEPVLLIECPRFLFPFARRVVADAVRDGGFPPLMLDPIDFGQLYLQQLAQQEQLADGEMAGQA